MVFSRSYLNSKRILILSNFIIKVLLHNINTNYNKADITYLVNFLRFKKIFENYNFKVNLDTQRNFLLNLGFETRLENLSKNIVDVNEKQIFIANNKKVVDEKSMGDLFKVMEVF